MVSLDLPVISISQLVICKLGPLIQLPMYHTISLFITLASMSGLAMDSIGYHFPFRRASGYHRGACGDPSLVAWWAEALPRLRIYHIPVSGWRSAAEAVDQKPSRCNV